MFRDKIRYMVEDINFLFDNGGLGDNICAMPVVKYLIDTTPNMRGHFWFPDYFYDVAKNMLPNADINKFSDSELLYNNKFSGRKAYYVAFNNLASHMVDHAFFVLANKQVEITEKNYLPLNLNEIDISKYSLPEKYVVLTVGYTAKVREMKSSIVNKLVSYIKERGYSVLFLGSRTANVGASAEPVLGKFSENIEYSRGKDLIGLTTLLEAGKIIAGAKCLIGLDNGLMHLAGCTETPIVGGFTTVEPKLRFPYRHNELAWKCYPVVPTEKLKCRFCQSNWKFVFDHDFRECFYKKKKLDNEIQCTKLLTADLYIEQLEKLL